ncbi:hypothetical protein OGAPHI_003586 [Ogataea philodendri]|uniref:DNA mismatch repair protein n=1 Tax=Ogataea philodendri TaxID=1378263 RepID=A0A9P8P571_9ASCO|nr:uncharacterized protein OGAPHI_003586 [Ogataea philodendri]KAH3665402.1 hypothetical protein OGAPHI_003586 [Ogataea philodendri]
MPLTDKGSVSSTTKGPTKYKQSSLLSFFTNSKPKEAKTASNRVSDSESLILTPNNSSPLREEKKDCNKTQLFVNGTEQVADHAETFNLNSKSDETLGTPKSPNEFNTVTYPFGETKQASPLSNSKRMRGDSVDESSDEEIVSLNPRKRKDKRRRNILSDEEDEDFELGSDISFEISDEEFKPEDENDDIQMDREGSLTRLNTSSAKSKDRNPKSSNGSSNGEDSSAAGHMLTISHKFEATSSYSPTPEQKVRVTKQKRQTPQSKFVKENEERYQWLVNIKDAEGRMENEADYDPRTLFIPKSAWAKFTAFERQYWEIKCKMWDSIVFFKKGKFYELYEKDADIGHQKFDLKLAGTGRANMRLAGIPEMSFDYWAKKFIDEGFKVAKVDQKESLLAKEMRERTAITKDDKVIKRELSCVLTCGTLTDEAMLGDEMSKYCLALKETINSDNTRTIGVSFVDTASGNIRLTQFDDDSDYSKLETLLAQIQPMEVLVEKSKVSPSIVRMLRFNSQPHAGFNFLRSQSEFWDFDTTFEQLTRGKYFEAADLDDLSNYPPVLVEYYENRYFVGFSAFGALLWYLKSLKLDSTIVSMGNIERYDPYKASFSDTCMRLDGVTLQNLEIFSNSFDQSDKGTLFKLLNRAVTPFGKRAFKSWVTHPLMSHRAINSRLDSVEALLADGELKCLLERKLGMLPDLERLLARIHSGNLKVRDFSRCVSGFQTIAELVASLKTSFSTSSLKMGSSLETSLHSFPPELDDHIKVWINAFDRDLAEKEGVLVPEKGIEPEFDDSNKNMKEIEAKLQKVISEYRREYRCQEICYKDSGKEIFLIEVPSKAVSKIPNEWQQMAATSKCKRYWSPEVRTLVKSLMEARELHKILCESLQTKMYSKFMLYKNVWSAAIQLTAHMDCILSLARASESLGMPACRPEFIDEPFAQIEFEELRHPCFVPGGITGTKDFIPNDIALGKNQRDHIGLLTGANAAGKSTVLRMTCVATIMAQIGCYVPAKKARLTAIDTIMTRLGANDNIMQGKSTFYVELSETKKMLESCTPRSLIILDELGRGGSSSDGFAIAEAVLHHFATHIQSIGFFATHYATLGNSFLNNPRVKPLRMGIIADDTSRDITFLYKLEPGESSGSFGMHVAAMCGISKDIIDNAEVSAEKWEHTSKLKKAKEQEIIVPLGLQSDVCWMLDSRSIGADGILVYTDDMRKNALSSMFSVIERL